MASFRTQELLEPNPEYGLTSVIPVDCDPAAYPDEEKNFALLGFVGKAKQSKDESNLELIRGGIKRAINPCPALQTGFWIYVPTGSGKSTFVSWLSSVVGDRAVEMP